ncbi:MAG: TA system VapC family ribonuclease toxin [Bryobacteraceae bacterium]
MAWLLDVNVLIALMDSAHEHHDAALTWFLQHEPEGWATCPVTENGFVRVLSGHGYPNISATPGQAAHLLRRLKLAREGNHVFWPDDVSIADPLSFSLDELRGSRQVTDAYLVALCVRRGGRLATFDNAVPWKAVNGAAADVVVGIGS